MLSQLLVFIDTTISNDKNQEKDIFVVCIFNRPMMLTLQFSAAHVLK